MVTTREKLNESDFDFTNALDADLSTAFGDEIKAELVFESALYVFDGQTYETSDETYFIDWQNGRWHVSLQETTYDYRDGKLSEIASLINTR